MNDKPTRLGKSTVQSGLEMNALGFRPGTPPSSVFMQLPLRADPGRFHLVLSGIDEQVRRFVRRVDRLARDRRIHLKLWSFDAERTDRAARLELAATCLGIWPTSRHEIIQPLSADGSASRQWTKIYVDTLAYDADRTPFVGDEEIAAIWIDLYLEQAVIAARAGVS